MGSQQNGKPPLDSGVITLRVASAGKVVAHVAPATGLRVVGKERCDLVVDRPTPAWGLIGKPGDYVAVHGSYRAWRLAEPAAQGGQRATIVAQAFKVFNERLLFFSHRDLLRSMYCCPGMIGKIAG
jgi:hypothetical protein